MFTKTREPADMRMFVSAPDATARARAEWLETVFTARAVAKGGVVRRAVKDVDREIGRDVLAAEVVRRGFHMVQSGDQFLIICNNYPLRFIC